MPVFFGQCVYIFRDSGHKGFFVGGFFMFLGDELTSVCSGAEGSFSSFCCERNRDVNVHFAREDIV